MKKLDSKMIKRLWGDGGPYSQIRVEREIRKYFKAQEIYLARNRDAG